MKIKRAVVFTGGLGPGPEKIENDIREAEIIVAADSGWDLAVGMGIIPDYYIGDMDSVQNIDSISKIPDNRIIKYPVEKDDTDTELALKFLNERNYRDIVLIGGGGGRIDHLLAITSMFSGAHRPNEWFTADEHIIYIDNDQRIQCVAGQTVSFFSCQGIDTVLSTNGMKWELINFRLDSLNFSLSNISLKDSIDIKVHSGALLVIKNYL